MVVILLGFLRRCRRGQGRPRPASLSYGTAVKLASSSRQSSARHANPPCVFGPAPALTGGTLLIGHQSLRAPTTLVPGMAGLFQSILRYVIFLQVFLLLHYIIMQSYSLPPLTILKMIT